MENEKQSVPVASQLPTQTKKNDIDFSSPSLFSLTKRFSILAKLINRDWNNIKDAPKFYRYDKDSLVTYLKDPYTYQDNIREAVKYINGVSSHFSRLMEYFSSLTNFAYIVSPTGVSIEKENKNMMKLNFHRVLQLLDSSDLDVQGRNIVKTCFLYDTFAGYIWETGDAITIQQLPIKYCRISSIEGNVLNIAFNFSYFDSYKDLLAFYPEEFTEKYNNIYKKNSSEKWIELESPNAFAVKFNRDILDYNLPPFAGLLMEIYDLQDTKELKLTKEELENYALLLMKLPMSEEGDWLIDSKKAKEFFDNLSYILPEEIGAVLSPMNIEKITFDRNETQNVDEVADAEENLFTAAGVSSLIFNNAKASANALLTSIKSDQSLTYSVVKSIEDVLNRYIHSKSYGKKFNINFLNISDYNYKEQADEYMKGCQYGLPMVSRYAAAMGVRQSEIESMNFLEVDVLSLHSKFIPLRNSAQISSEETIASDGKVESDNIDDVENGRPKSDEEDLTDSGAESREDWDNGDAEV